MRTNRHTPKNPGAMTPAELTRHRLTKAAEAVTMVALTAAVAVSIVLLYIAAVAA